MIKKGILSVISIVGSIIVIVIFFYLGSSVQQVPPSNLKVLADHKYKTYISPECVSPSVDYSTEEFELTTFEIASKELNYTEESVCTYESLFPERNSLWNFIGKQFGLLRPLNWKWNEDGTWKDEVFQ